MPESAEVKIITEQLRQYFSNKILEKINIIGGRFNKKLPNNFENIKNNLPLKIDNIKCKGKFIYWSLSGNWHIFNTLGMTGSWTSELTKHSAVEFIINDKVIYFTDPRRFGTLNFISGKENLDTKLNELGPDLLSDPPSLLTFINLFKNRNKNITIALMNQKTVSGVGNYIKAEGLYRAKISPWRTCNTLNDTELESLYWSLRDVITESYKQGGATLATYKDFNGQAGTFSKNFKVYRKAKDPFDNEVIAEDTLDKRTTWWVPNVQR